MHAPDQRLRRRWSGLFGAIVALIVASALLLPYPPTVARAASDVYFSEYIEGTSNNKALEIYNGTGAPVDLAAGQYVVQMYFNANSTVGLTIPLTGTVANGDVFVLAQASANATILVQADQTNASGWYNGNDTVVLKKGGAGGTIVDSIGQIANNPPTEWGTGLTSTADNTLRRKTSVASGDTNPNDTFDPALQWDGFPTDSFNDLGTYNPGGSGDTAPSVSSTSPSNNATNVAVGTNIAVTFSEAVTAPASAFALSCNGGNQAFALSPSSGSSPTFTLDPNASLPTNATCTVTITGASVTDVDGPPDPVAGSPSFSFTTAAPAPTVLIRDIQGAGHTSPKAGQTVTNVSGIVTAKRTDGTGNSANTGFYLQDPSPDADDRTSEAIFVRTQAGAAPVNVGDAVTVLTGTVREFRPGCTSQSTWNDCSSGSGLNNLTLTWLVVASNGDIQVTPTNNPLPAAIVIGTGGRVPPTTHVSDDVSNIDTATGPTFDPANDGADFFESLEFMRVQVNAPVAVGPTASFGEIPVLADGGVGATGLRTPRGGILYNSYADDQPERIQLDDQITGAGSMPNVHVGATLGAAVGVIDYSFANYKLEVTAPPAVASNPLQRETTSTPGADQLSVATFNVENLTVGNPVTNPQSKFDTLAALIANNLKAPDLIVVEEVQDNNGATDGVNDTVVAANETYAKLIQTIQTNHGVTYQYQQIDPQSDLTSPFEDFDGGEPGGNIRVGFLFRTDRGLAFVPRSSGGLDCSTGSPTPPDCATTATTVQNVGGQPQLSLSPGRIAPTDGAWAASRKPLAGELTYNGRRLFVVGNHFNSKGGDQPLYGRFDPPSRSSEAQRHQQATLVNQFVDSILTIDPNAYVIVAGDFNDFDFSQTLNILRTGDAAGSGDVELHNLYETLPPNERYSYVFEGNSQILDSILVSPALATRPTVLVMYDVVHANAEFADQASDHDPSVARFLIDATPPTVTCSVNPSSLWPPNHKLWDVTLTVNVTDTGSGPAGWKLVSVSSNEPDSGDGDIQGWTLGTPDTAGQVRAERAGAGSGRIYTFLVEGQDSQGNTGTCATTVTVAHDQGGGNGR